jgi:hypothetical protein
MKTLEEIIKEAWQGREDLHPYSIEHESMEEAIKLTKKEIEKEIAKIIRHDRALVVGEDLGISYVAGWDRAMDLVARIVGKMSE